MSLRLGVTATDVTIDVAASSSRLPVSSTTMSEVWGQQEIEDPNHSKVSRAETLGPAA